MIRLVLILVALAVGFGVGVYWGVKNPTQAQQLASVEEKQFIEKQKVLLEKMKRKLDELSSARGGTATITPSGRSGFAASGAGGGTAARPDPELDELKREADQQLQEANKLAQKK
jgi:hypothetical protein